MDVCDLGKMLNAVCFEKHIETMERLEKMLKF